MQARASKKTAVQLVAPFGRYRVMATKITEETYDEPSTVKAQDGKVVVDGPDGVDVTLTPEAARETSDRLLESAMKALGQRHLRHYPHRA